MDDLTTNQIEPDTFESFLQMLNDSIVPEMEY